MKEGFAFFGASCSGRSTTPGGMLARAPPSSSCWHAHGRRRLSFPSGNPRVSSKECSCSCIQERIGRLCGIQKGCHAHQKEQGLSLFLGNGPRQGGVPPGMMMLVDRESRFDTSLQFVRSWHETAAGVEETVSRLAVHRTACVRSRNFRSCDYCVLKSTNTCPNRWESGA